LESLSVEVKPSPPSRLLSTTTALTGCIALNMNTTEQMAREERKMRNINLNCLIQVPIFRISRTQV